MRGVGLGRTRGVGLGRMRGSGARRRVRGGTRVYEGGRGGAREDERGWG